MFVERCLKVTKLNENKEVVCTASRPETALLQVTVSGKSGPYMGSKANTTGEGWRGSIIHKRVAKTCGLLHKTKKEGKKYTRATADNLKCHLTKQEKNI